MPNRACHWLLTALIAAAPGGAAAFGADGHRIVGLLAAPLLCARAEREIGRLVGGRSLEDFGYWADTVRDDPAWQHSAAWHYVNVPDGVALRDLEHPPEGNVLWAIDNFARVLADEAQPDAARAVALQFLAHFVADVHQPLHVGRAEDRGGDEVRVRYGRTVTDLHSFWDSDAITLREQMPDRYARRLEPLLESLPRGPVDLDPIAWAEESLALRGAVYAFDRSGELDRDYLDAAARIVDERLAHAGLRLAAMLNFAFCGTGAPPARRSAPPAQPAAPSPPPRRLGPRR